MADKEERIYITEVKEGDVCPFEENCEGFYKLCEGCNVLPTRQEAIERMAKAICASNMAPDCLWECETCDRWKGSDKEAAEAALNALLEDNNASKN